MSEVKKIKKLKKELKNLALTVECEPHGSPNVMQAVISAYNVLREVEKGEKEEKS